MTRAFAILACVGALFAACAPGSALSGHRAVCPAVDRTSARTVLRTFVRTAVRRHSVGCSWPLAAKSLRRGFTRSSWAKGDIPVVPDRSAQLAHHLHQVHHPHKVTARIEFSDAGFSAELVRRHGQWRVSYWMPNWSPWVPT